MNVKDYSYSPVVNTTLKHLEQFYTHHPELCQSDSHGLDHALAVHQHAFRAIQSLREEGVPRSSPDGTSTDSGGNVVVSLSDKVSNEIQLAALLHDVDDPKYSHHDDSCDNKDGSDSYPNARRILSSVLEDFTQQLRDEFQPLDVDRILYMIDLVSCSQNGNDVPTEISDSSTNSGSQVAVALDYQYHWLIPRWSDRLEAVGRRGVIRCYQYTLEKERPLWSDCDPRPKSETEVWDHVTSERFNQYLAGGSKHKEKNKIGDGTGTSSDTDSCTPPTSGGDTMMSHYYDKLLHIARPPPGIVQNIYLEREGRHGSLELVEICVRFGLTGRVDEDYIRRLMSEEKQKME